MVTDRIFLSQQYFLSITDTTELLDEYLPLVIRYGLGFDFMFESYPDLRVFNDSSERIAKLTTAFQLHQRLRIELCWCGSSPIWICRPLRIICYLGDLKIAALVDTGSDYDAIDKDLSELQSERNNVAFKGRTRSRRVNVSGFATVMNHTTDSIAEWVLTICGTKVSCGPRFTLEYTVSVSYTHLTLPTKRIV